MVPTQSHEDNGGAAGGLRSVTLARSLRENAYWLLPAAVALILQLLYLAEGHRDPTFYRPIVDAGEYHREAQLIAWGLPLAREPYWQPPLYAYVLAAAYAVSGGSILFAKFLQALSGAACCAIVALLGRRLFHRTAGLIAGLWLAVSGPFTFYNLQLLPSGLSVLLNLVVVILLLRAVEVPAGGRWFACGLATGLSALALPNVLLPVAGVMVWLLFTRGRAGLGGRRAVTRVAILAGGIVLAILPATVRNLAVSGEFIPISYNGGYNLYLGNNPDAWETTAARPGFPSDRLLALPRQDGAHGAAAAQAWFVREVGRFVGSHPGAFATGILKRADQFLNAREIPRNEDPYQYRDDSAVLGVLLWRWGAFGFPFGLLLPLAILGVLAGGAATRPRRLVLLFVCLYSISILAFFVSSRHRLPVAALLGLFAGSGVAWLASRVRARDTLRVAGGLALVLGVGLWVNRSIAAPSDGVDFRAERLSMLGGSAIVEGRLDRAETLYREAIEQDPSVSETHVRLGGVYELLGRRDEATAEYQRAIDLDPNAAQAYLHLGIIVGNQGRHDEAERFFRQAIEAWPAYPQAHQFLGYSLALSGTEGWIDAYRNAWRLDHDPREPFPDPGEVLLEMGPSAAALRWFAARVEAGAADPTTRLGLARALTRVARERGPESGSRELSTALQVASQVAGAHPGLAAAHRALGDVFLTAGRFADARREYEEALRLEPKRATDHLTYANVLRALGNETEGRRELRRAIALDPALTEAYEQLGSLLARRGDHGRARRYLTRAAQLRGFALPGASR